MAPVSPGLILASPDCLQLALGSSENAKRFSMKSGQQKYFDNLITLFPQEEAAIKEYRKRILVSTSLGGEYSYVYCNTASLQLACFKTHQHFYLRETVIHSCHRGKQSFGVFSIYSCFM